MEQVLKYQKTKRVREVKEFKVPDFPFYMKDMVHRGYHTFYKFTPVYWKHEEKEKLTAVNVVKVQFKIGIYDDISDVTIDQERYNVDGDEVLHEEGFNLMIKEMEFITEFDYRKEFFRAVSYLNYSEYEY